MQTGTRGLLRGLDALGGKLRGELRGAQAAVVEAYDAERQQVELSFPQPFPVLVRDDDGEDRVEHRRQPSVDEVPVLFPGTPAGALSYPLAPGDQGLFLVYESDHGAYQQTGETVAELRNTERHTLACGGIFVPMALANTRTVPAAEGATVLSGDDVRLAEATATQAMARADRAEAQLRALAERVWFMESWLNQFASFLELAYPSMVAGGAAGGVPLSALPPSWTTGSPLMGIPVGAWGAWGSPAGVIRPWIDGQGALPTGYYGTGNTGADKVKGV